MGRKVKDSAFGEDGAAIGHNQPSQESEYKFTLKVFEALARRQKADDEIKSILNKAKDEGHLKTPIRKVANEMHKAAESMQAKREVERQTQRLRRYVADQDGQYDFLVESNDDEAEAA